MNEPLNTSRPGISFAGKTHNKHPQWYNQPLRLSKEQKRDPLPVLDDFFECYHLKDVREKLWEWVSEVVSSPNDISSEPLERSSHLYFYEKIEEVIEAAYVMKGKLHKRIRRIEKRRLKKSRRPEKNWAIVLDHVNLNTDKSLSEAMAERKIKYYHKRFIERLPIKEEPDVQYIKSRYYPWVKTFIEEYFLFEKNVLPEVLLDKSFAIITSGIVDLDMGDMSNLENFQHSLSCLILAYAYVLGGKLKVSEKFYIDQFINAFEIRASLFTRYTIDRSEIILRVLRSVEFSNDESIELLENAMDFADAKMKYYYSEKSYINCLVNFLVKLGKEKGKSLTREMLLPQKFKQKSNK